MTNSTDPACERFAKSQMKIRILEDYKRLRYLYHGYLYLGIPPPASMATQQTILQKTFYCILGWQPLIFTFYKFQEKTFSSDLLRMYIIVFYGILSKGSFYIIRQLVTPNILFERSRQLVKSFFDGMFMGIGSRYVGLISLARAMPITAGAAPTKKKHEQHI